MVTSLTNSIKFKWLKLNNNFSPNNSSIKPQFMLMQDKLKLGITLLFLDQQSMLPKTDPSESSGEMTSQGHIFYPLISVTHSNQIKPSLSKFLLSHMHMESQPTHQVMENLKHIGL